MKPLAIELYAGLHGWGEGFIAEGYRVIGFDIVDMCAALGQARPDGIELVLQDALTLHGSQFRDAACIVASPPCQRYSYMAQPWQRAKREVRWQQWERDSPFGDRLAGLRALFDACFRIQREACEAAGRHIPMVAENVKGAQPWVGRAKAHYGSYYLWGDVPALMPITMRTVKVDGFNFHQHEKGLPGGSFQSAAVAATKNGGGSWFAQAHNTGSGHSRNPVTGEGPRKGTGGSWFTPEPDGRTKQGHWRDGGCVTRCYNSKDSRRKAASAQIAKIPFELSRHIAAIYKP